MNERELVARRKQLLEEAVKILTSPEVSAEDMQKAEAMKEDAQKIEKQIATVREVMAQLEHASEEIERVAAKDVPQAGVFTSEAHFLREVAKAGDIRYHGRVHPGLKGFSSVGEEGPESKWEIELAKGTKATMVENVGERGGFLVPQEYRATLFGVQPEASIVRSRATIIPMARRQVLLPAVDQTDTTEGAPHWFGGILAYWTEEAAEKTQAEPTFRQITLTAYELTCYSRMSEMLLEDSAISLEGLLRSQLGFPGAIQWAEEYAFLRGTGAGQPLGILNAGCTITVARAADMEITVADLANMMASFLMTGGRGCWIISQSAMGQMIQLAGPTSNPSYFWQPSGREGVPGTLFGLPVFWTEKLPTLGTAGDVVLANLPYYYVGDRLQATIEASNHEYFRYNQISWRATHRVGGQPALSAPLTLTDGSTQISPFVILGDKSS